MGKNKKSSESVKDERTRTWAFVGYPESMPANWKEILNELAVPWACSPPHDKDINETTNEHKKVHRHFVLSFEGKKSYEQIKEITDKLGAPAPQKCRSIRGAVRYFLHLDNPEKAQYSDRKNEILYGGGFDVEDALKLTATEEEALLFEILEWIERNWIIEYCDFISFVRKEKKEWFSVVRKNTYLLTSTIKSQRHKLFREEEERRRNL